MTQSSESNSDASAVLLDIPTLRTLGKPYSFNMEMRFDDLALPPGTPAPFHVEGELHFNSTGFQVVGTLFGSIQQVCDRCASEYIREIDEPFDESFAYEELMQPKGSGEFELLADDFYETHASDAPFDLRRLIEELLIIILSYDRFCNTDTCVAQA